MEARKWKTRIAKHLRQADIDPKQYDSLVRTLSDILEQRDICFEQYLKDGPKPVIEYTNKAGATNVVKNPKLVMWIDLNTQALSYWRELGLTPSAYKKMTGGKQGDMKGSALVAALNSLEAG